jgi:predicted DNA-binding protein (MmcQ/YjbR family)
MGHALVMPRRRSASMTRDDVIEFCSSRPEVVEDFPFGDEVAVFKVAGKMFALVSLTGPAGFVNLKCDPDLALELRDRHVAVRPGYHANKRHWNTVDLDVPLDGDDLREMIDHSYDLVIAGLPRAQRDRLRRD